MPNVADPVMHTENLTCDDKPHYYPTRSVDVDKLDVKDECRVLGNAGDILAAICVLCWNGETTFAANSHALNTNVPALDHLSGAELERERFALLVR